MSDVLHLLMDSSNHPVKRRAGQQPGSEPGLEGPKPEPVKTHLYKTVVSYIRIYVDNDSSYSSLCFLAGGGEHREKRLGEKKEEKKSGGEEQAFFCHLVADLSIRSCNAFSANGHETRLE